MGQFSWYYSDTNKQLIDNKHADTYLLVPSPFRDRYGAAIYENCYDGYGHFYIYDIYELIAEWNRDFLSISMLRKKPKLEQYGGLYSFEKEELAKQGLSEEEIEAKDQAKKQANFERGMAWYNLEAQRLLDYKAGLSNEEMAEKYGKDWKREVGINIAGGDERNFKLLYPIKITSKEMPYDEAKPSKRDPNQGW